MLEINKVPLKEKIGYALGDGAANIAWRGVATFLFIFYTDVFGLNPATAGLVLLTARFSDGISDILMGIIGDKTKSKYGKFRPWILWTAIPLGLTLALLFTTPNFGETGKIIYAYISYILFTLIYTANNIPYGALMGVMTGNDKERTSIGSFRMTGAFAGGMLVQVLLLFLVAYFGNVEPKINVSNISEGKFKVEVIASRDAESVGIKTEDGLATIAWADAAKNIDTPLEKRLNFNMVNGEKYSFIIEGEKEISDAKISIIDQKKGYSNSMYIMSAILALLMLATFAATKERVLPPKTQKSNLLEDFKNLLTNKPWLVLIIIGLLFNIYNAIKQGIVIIYFTHYLNDALLSATYLFGLGIASIAGALITAPLSKKLGKRNLFIYALIFSGIMNALLILCDQSDISGIFTLGIISEFSAAIFPTLFFVMLGDIADYSEWKDGRRATGLIYSAGSFATKFGGGIAGALIGFVLAAYNYESSPQEAFPAIKMLMSWIPSIMTFAAAALMFLYPLTSKKMSEISTELQSRRTSEGDAELLQ